MQEIWLNPTEVTATYNDGVLRIEASGEEDGVKDIRIVPDDTEPIEPPPFRVEGEPSPAIGMFPYKVQGEFRLAEDPHQITLETPSGDRLVPVRSLTSY